jgi:hypothetical protein
VRAILLMPLEQVERAERRGPGVFSLVLRGGETWRVEIDEPSRRVIELRGPSAAVRFIDFLDTGYTVLPATVDIEGRGTFGVKILAHDLYLAPSVFTDPFVEVDPGAARSYRAMTETAPAGEELPGSPELQSIPARSYLVLRDPGAWAERTRAVLAAGGNLQRRAQMPAGLPVYAAGDEGDELLIPFQPDPERGYRPFVRRDREVVRHGEPHRAVVVAPPPGPWAEAVQRGRSMVSDFLTAQNLEANGPLRVIPFLAPDAVPTEEERQAIYFRLEQAVRNR